MKILLLNANGPVREQIAPPLGLAYLHSALRKAGYKSIHILDAQLLNMTALEASDHIRLLMPDITAISGTYTHADWIHQLCSYIDDITFTVVGGAYANSAPFRIIGDRNVSAVIKGESEEALPLLVKACKSGWKGFSEPPFEIPGLIYRHKDEIHQIPPIIPDIDTISLPEWSGFDIESYGKRHIRSQHFVHPVSLPVIASRGCSGNCSYCHGFHGKTFRPRDLDSVVNELEYLHKNFGVKEFHFQDDGFNLDNSRSIELLQKISACLPEVAIKFPNGIRIDMADEALIDAAAHAGCYQMSFGIELEPGSTSRKANRPSGVTLEKTSRLALYAGKNNIHTHGFFTLAFPGDTPQDIEKRISIASELPLHTASFFTVIPFPGTQMRKELESEGVNFPDMPALYHYDQCYINAASMDAEMLYSLKKSGFKNFYFNPGRMLSILRVNRSPLELITRNLDWFINSGNLQR